jgi:hypothetical protein
VGEDGNYIWQRSNDGIWLWKDVNALFFAHSGEIHKLSIWNFPEYWKSHCILYKEIAEDPSCVIEQPIYHEYIDSIKMGYSIIQRPGNNLGLGFIELLMMDKITEETIMASIDDMMILFKHLCRCNDLYGSPFPFPPKQFENASGKFWGDFKYWKYDREEFKQNYMIGIERFLPVLSNDYNIPLNTHIILEKLYHIWKI